MRRREFIAGFGGAVAWPLVARAQRSVKARRIGILTLISQKDEGGRTAAFVAGLREIGIVPGRNAEIDYRYADGDTERLTKLALELVSLGPDVIYAGEPTTARAIKKIAPGVPIVCPALTDELPDLYASYSRPGGSVTGVASSVENMHAKLVELIFDIIPKAVRIGLLVNSQGANRATITRQIEAAVHARRASALVEAVRTPAEIGPSFDRWVKAQADAVVIAPNGMLINERREIVRFALDAKIPTFFEQRADVAAGGFLSYGVDETEGSRRLSVYVDKILKGAKPGDLPIEFPTKIELAINLKTAQTLGLAVSREMMLRANELIE